MASSARESSLPTAPTPQSPCPAKRPVTRCALFMFGVSHVLCLCSALKMGPLPPHLLCFPEHRAAGFGAATAPDSEPASLLLASVRTARRLRPLGCHRDAPGHELRDALHRRSSLRRLVGMGSRIADLPRRGASRRRPGRSLRPRSGGRYTHRFFPRRSLRPAARISPALAAGDGRRTAICAVLPALLGLGIPGQRRAARLRHEHTAPARQSLFRAGGSGWQRRRGLRRIRC
jgi:hypothetical protein